MERAALAGVVDRLASEFPALGRFEVERAVATAWSLFGDVADDIDGRIRVAEWYARTQLCSDLAAAATES